MEGNQNDMNMTKTSKNSDEIPQKETKLSEDVERIIREERMKQES